MTCERRISDKEFSDRKKRAEEKLCSPAEYDKLLAMKKWTAVSGGDSRQIERRSSHADGAKLRSMTATEERTAATHRCAAGIRSRPGGKVRSAAEHEIESEEGARSLDSRGRR